MSNKVFKDTSDELTLPKNNDEIIRNLNTITSTDFEGGYRINSCLAKKNDTGELISTESKALQNIDNFVLKVPNYQSKQKTFEVLQKWEGFVSSVDKKNRTFSAQISDVTNENNPDEEVQVSFDEISESDIPLIEEGAIFYWVIGYQKEKNGQNLRSSAIRFRRLPAWSKRELKKAKESANELSKYFNSSKNK